MSGEKEKIAPNILEVRYGDKSYSFERKMIVKRLIEVLGLNPESIMVVRNGELVTKDETLMPGDRVQVISVISGG